MSAEPLRGPYGSLGRSPHTSPGQNSRYLHCSNIICSNLEGMGRVGGQKSLTRRKPKFTRFLEAIASLEVMFSLSHSLSRSILARVVGVPVGWRSGGRLATMLVATKNIFCQAQQSSLKPQLKLSFSCILNFTPPPTQKRRA